MNICYTLLFFSILFFFSRVVRLFRANQQKKASLSLVKITEEFKMQVVRQEKYKLKYRHWNSFFISETLACEILRSDFKLSFPFFLPLLPRPQHHPPPPQKKEKNSWACSQGRKSRFVQSTTLDNTKSSLENLLQALFYISHNLTLLQINWNTRGKRTIQGCINMIITNAFNSATSYSHYSFNFWQKSIVAILDCLISPRWPHPPCLASDTVPCLSWRNLQDTPTHFHVTYDILESDVNGRCPDEPGYEYTPRSCYYNLAKYCNRTLNKVTVLTTLGCKS